MAENRWSEAPAIATKPFACLFPASHTILPAKACCPTHGPMLRCCLFLDGLTVAYAGIEVINILHAIPILDSPNFPTWY